MNAVLLLFNSSRHSAQKTMMTLILFCSLSLLLLPWGSTAFQLPQQQQRLRAARQPNVVGSLRTSSTISTPGSDNAKLLPSKAYDTIQAGRIAVIPNFIPAQELYALRRDAENLHVDGRFSTDALAGYGSPGKFDASKDRAVLRLNQWKDTSLGDWETRRRFGSRMAALRADLAWHLDRPHLNEGLATTLYGNGSTEISYTRFGPGAFLRRHVDEHHEELKGRAGWSQPTRRSVSWLIYLNNADWNGARDGGQLRCFQRAMATAPSHTVGARPNGDLQIAWLLASLWDPVERPVFLDGCLGNGKVAMYVVDENNDGRVRYITKPFDAQPTLYIAGGEAIVKTALMESRDLADRFHFIEPPKSKIGDLFAGRNKQNYEGMGEDPGSDEVVADIDPTGGTLVVFDSVSLPHEVLATKTKDRWATSGWFHEDQQAAGDGHDRRRQA